jgi:putative phosphoribosyl transferase
MQMPIENRRTAGQELAKLLGTYQNRSDVVILALPRGGVPLGFEIAQALHAPLDLMLVRKLGTPNFPELAMGAIASGDIKVLNTRVVEAYNISTAEIDAVEQKERAELQRRERAYRGQHPYPQMQGKIVILVDDGLATGSTMRAAIDALRIQQPQKIVVAVPVAPPETIQALSQHADEIVCPLQPSYFSSIGEWYHDFSQVNDEQVIALLNQAWQA